MRIGCLDRSPNAWSTTDCGPILGGFVKLSHERLCMPGVIFYEGPSRLDGAPIVGIATINSENRKVGNLVQTWILRSDIPPVDAVRTGEDASICGSCPLRDISSKRGCYVLVGFAPQTIWHAYKRGRYPMLRDAGDLLADIGLRYGSYGEPVAIPLRYWDRLAKACKAGKHPGYTHTWSDRRFTAWSKRLMASVHSAEEAANAQLAGWRTFRTLTSVDQLAANEILCPASAEAGFATTCEHCGACNGKHGQNDKRRNVAIVAHGSGGKPQLFEQL